MATLVIVAHPDLDASQSQQFLQQAGQIEGVTWHHLDAITNLNVAQERQLLRQHQRIILQFPLYWYAAPASLKSWQDQVLTNNFLSSLHDKELALVVTTGLPQSAFRMGGAAHFSLDQFLLPYRAWGLQAQMKFLPTFAIYQFAYYDEIAQLQLLSDYRRYLTQTAPDSLLNRSYWFLNQLPKTNQDDGQLILAEYLEQRTQELEGLQDTLRLIKMNEEEANV
ncbi:NAD(P)H-dependent oxidoreductase [Lactobacillus sp. DCY120]|uniref:NAD(P)H-dependent oxidoreductase n=1 Tax=Bombilactobacillus apium TaxID=2675299 RepID=A0A850R7X2_9LACO|nr:NAD(P)H-dependent oxidoreductase [Bombilactobacillus apium]NVY96947.1 NAD(P)H-dependent oxidoreductase [Bombilactobacillus apium]